MLVYFVCLCKQCSSATLSFVIRMEVVIAILNNGSLNQLNMLFPSMCLN